MQYFVLVNKRFCVRCHHSKMLCILPSVHIMFFIWGTPPQLKMCTFFLQDYVLGYPDSRSRKGPYLTTVSDIKKCTQ